MKDVKYQSQSFFTCKNTFLKNLARINLGKGYFSLKSIISNEKIYIYIKTSKAPEAK